MTSSRTEIGFFTSAFYGLDNFSAHALTIWDMSFPTAEHAYQWKKIYAVRPDIAALILQAESPYAVKKILDAHKNDVSPTWEY